MSLECGIIGLEVVLLYARLRWKLYCLGRKRISEFQTFLDQLTSAVYAVVAPLSYTILGNQKVVGTPSFASEFQAHECVHDVFDSSPIDDGSELQCK